MYTNNIVVAGAGASGLMAAISAARQLRNAGSDAEVIILEHMERAGKKILQTGNGRCNLTNTYMTPQCYQNDNVDFTMNIIREFTPDDTIDFFNDIGVLTKVRTIGSKDNNADAGYVYPNSEQAAAVADALIREAACLDIRIIYDANITGISAASTETSTGIWNVEYEQNGSVHSIKATKVIIATGSKASPKSGSDGSGYRLAKSLGHHIIKPLPALVQLESSSPLCKNIAGVRQDASVRIIKDGSEIAASHGELQFTDYGISGIPVFQVSRYAVKAIASRSSVAAHIDLLPGLTQSGINSFISAAAAHNNDISLLDILSGMMNLKLARAVLDSLGIKYRFKASDCNGRDISVISHQIKELEMQLTGYKSFENAQICSGGVSLEEVDSHTLESGKAPGIFFCGEILDVDGICGGYNLQWAWSSGHLAGMMAADSLLHQPEADK